MVNEAVNSVEKHQDEWFDKLTKSLRAEIKTREANTESVYKKINDLDAKFAEALSIMDQENKLKQPGKTHSPSPLQQGNQNELDSNKNSTRRIA